MEKDRAEDVGPAYDKAKAIMTRMANEREEARKCMEGLYTNQGCGKQFRTMKDCDDHLRSQVQELEAARAENEELLVEK